MLKTVLSLFLLCSLIGYYYWNEVKPETTVKESLLATHKLLLLPEGESITGMKVFAGDSSFAVEGKEDLWRIIDPVLEPGDPLIIGGMERVLKLQNKEKIILDDAADLGEFGLADPEIRVGVKASFRRGYRYLLLGRQVPFETNYYAKWEDEAPIFTLNENARNTFDKTLYSIRDKNVFKISFHDRIKSIEVRLVPNEIVFEHDLEKDRWLIKEPFAELAKQELVDETLRELHGLFIKEFLDGKEISDEAFGLTRATKLIRVRTEKDKELALRLGNLTEDGEYYYASTLGRTVPLLIAKEKIDTFRKDPLSFIERKILVFNPFEVTRFIYGKGERLETVAKEEDTLKINGEEVDDDRQLFYDEVIKFLSTAEYEIILNEEGLRKFGFTKEDILFQLEMTLLSSVGAKGQEISVDILAKADGFFMRHSDDGNTYEISEDDYKELISLIEKVFP